LLVGGSHSRLSTNDFGNSSNCWVNSVVGFDSWCSPQHIITGPKHFILSPFKLIDGLVCKIGLSICNSCLGIGDNSFLVTDKGVSI
jgi:hypothetical protein